MENIVVTRGAETFVYVKRKENKHFLANVFRNIVPILADVD